MQETIYYASPYPKGSWRPPGAIETCVASIPSSRRMQLRMTCTREAGHGDDHEACGPGGVMYARWSNNATDGNGNA